MFLRFHTITCKKVIDANDKMATITLDRNPTTQEFPMKTFHTLSLICLFVPSLSYSMKLNQDITKINNDQDLLNNTLLSLANNIFSIHDLKNAIALLKQGANPYSANSDGIPVYILLNKALKQDFSPQIPLTPTSPDKPRALCFVSFRAEHKEEWANKNAESDIKAELKKLLADLPEAKNEQ